MVEHAYIHIPFCISKCKYCSFVSGLPIEYKDSYVDVLKQEIKVRYSGESIKTLYIGGGTPSLLSVNDVSEILCCFNFNDNPEITIEANPDTVSLNKFIGYKNSGINRVSLGVQSFDDEILAQIGRTHSGFQAKQAVETIYNSGINNISIDLIYGLPNQTINKWSDDLKQSKELEISHLSTYGLKIEEGSYFYNNKPENLADDELQADMYNFLCDYFPELNHYEISNFSKYGFESKHNCAYWLNKEYYGFGVNASGYENNIRYKNVSDLKTYIKNPLKKEEYNKVTIQENLENEIFLALRLKSGINIEAINKNYNINFKMKYRMIIEKYKQAGLLVEEENRIKLTRKGILLSNEVMTEFIN